MSKAVMSLKQVLRALKAGRSVNLPPDTRAIDYTSSAAFTIDKSKFQGFTGSVSTELDVCSMLVALYADPVISKATHNMFAFKLSDGTVGHGDDGEAGGGQSIMRVLEGSGETDRMVVVSRWYGGVHMGSSRFRAIAEAAKKSLDVK